MNARPRLLLAFVAVAALSCPGRVADPEVRVRRTAGGPQLFLDGKAIPPRMLFVRAYAKPADGGDMWEQRAYHYSVEQTRIAHAHGVDLVTFLSPLLWEQEDEESPRYWEPLDIFCRDLIAANPDVLLVPRVYVNPPEWWRKRHPEASMAFDEKNVHSNCGAVTSPEYLRAAVRHLERTIAHLQAAFPANFAGIHFAGQNTGEWFYDRSLRPCLSGYDPSTRSAWRRHLAAIGVPDAGDAQVPTPDERSGRVKKRILLDPVEDAMAVEFNRFYNASMADFVGELARTCRAATKGRKLVLTFYGYAYELANNAKGMAASGHLAAQRLIDRYGDSIDMVCAPFGYGSEREWLGSEPVMSAAETFARNGIMWVNEDDTRTHLDSRPAEKRLQEGASKDLSQSCDVMMRNTAQCAVRGMGCWWMDLKGTGWFADPAIWNVMTQLAPIDRKMAARGTPFAPDVASIIDEESCLHLGWVCGRVSAWTFRQMRGVLARCGAPYGQYLLSDVVRNPIGAKLQLFHAAWALSDTQIAAMEKDRVDRPDITRVWFWAPGYVNPRTGCGTERMERLVGFKLKAVSFPSNTIAASATGLRLGLPSLFPNARDIAPLFAAADATPEETWGVWPDGSAAIAVRRNHGGTGSGYSVFYGGTWQPPEVVGAFLRLAGVHRWHDAPGKLVLWATDGMLSVQALEAGRYILHVPSEDGSGDIEIRLRQGETKVIGL